MGVGARRSRSPQDAELPIFARSAGQLDRDRQFEKGPFPHGLAEQSSFREIGSGSLRSDDGP
eukprot:33432-Alexandrium_andersonii.AAC.1